jgi:ribosome maturation factor RimP
MQQNYGLDDILKPEVTGLGYEYVGAEYICGSQTPILRVYIDAETGVDVEACHRVSRQINALLHVEIAAKKLGISKDYILEVSSPGVNRKLFTAEQGIKQIGKKIKLVLRVPRDVQKKFVGTLTSVEGNTFILLIGEQNISFDFSEIEKAQVVPEW